MLLQGNLQDGDLMRVAVDDITALVVLCAGGREGDASVRSLVEHMDPPSVGVPLQDLVRLQLSAALSGATVLFCGNTQVRLLEAVSAF